MFPGDTFTIQEATGRYSKTRIGIGLTPSLIEKDVETSSKSKSKFALNSNSDSNLNSSKQICEAIQVTRAGVLQSFSKSDTPKVWVQNNQKKYIPRIDDRVIGVIIQRTSFYYKVDINAPMIAILDCLEFEGATKRNKPELKVGDVVFGRVLIANKDMSPQLSCKSGTLNSINNKSWVTGESLFMQLKGGYIFKCSLNWCFKLNRFNSPHLMFLGKFFPFECAIGINGKIWIKAATIGQTILLANVLQNGEFMGIKDFTAMVHAMLHKYGITGTAQAKARD